MSGADSRGGGGSAPGSGVRITEDELQQEYAKLDLLREKAYDPLLTREQFRLIDYARTNQPPVTWAKIAAYWESRGWGRISQTTLKARYQRDKYRGQSGALREGR